MAYVDETLLENEEEQGGPTVSGSAASNQVQQTPSNSAPSQTAKKTPGNFANLTEYLRVNKPLQFGEQVAGKIGGEIDEGSKAVSDAETEFKSRVDGNTVRDTQGLTEQISANPMGVDVGAFKQLRDASYGGPKTLADTQDLSSRVLGATGTATGKAAASGTESGRFALLDSYFGKPQYSRGQKTLDNLLIQNDPNSQQAFAEMRTRADQLSDTSKNMGAQLEQYGSSGAQTTADTRTAARGALGIDDAGNMTGEGALGSSRNAINERLTSENARLQKEFQDAKAMAGQNRFGLRPEFLKAMGISVSPQNFGVDPTKFIQSNPALAKENVATMDEATRLRALEALADQQNYLDADDSKIGTAADAKGFRFDTDRFGKEVGVQRAAYRQDAKQADEAVKAAEAALANIPNQIVLGGDADRQRAVHQLQAQLAAAKAARQNVDHKYFGKLRSPNWDPTKKRDL